jgi:glycogen debranching enzyme
MDDVIQVHDQYYILATASRASERTSVLKHNDTFALFDQSGDIAAFGMGDQGLYHEGTRFLSRFNLRLNGHRPLLLSSRVKDDNELFGADLTNPDLPLGEGDLVLARDLVHLFRGRLLWDATLHERIRLWNYSRAPVRVALTFDIDADFADIFEVRGTVRQRRGTRLPPIAAATEMRLGYRGLDDEERWTVIEWSDTPTATAPGMARFEYELAPQSPSLLTVAIRCEREQRPIARTSFERAESALAAAIEHDRAGYAVVEASSERFNQWVRRSSA